MAYQYPAAAHSTKEEKLMAKRRPLRKRNRQTKATLVAYNKTLTTALACVQSMRDELVQTVTERTKMLDEWRAEATRLRADCQALQVKVADKQVGIDERNDQIKKLETRIDTLGKDRETIARGREGYEAITDTLFELSATKYTPPELATALSEKLGKHIYALELLDHIEESLRRACSDAATMAWHRAQALQD
jgi:chromosome segregation ATPase